LCTERSVPRIDSEKFWRGDARFLADDCQQGRPYARVGRLLASFRSIGFGVGGFDETTGG
jgi:hypothetical protein